MPKKKNWLLKIKCEVTKEIYVENCTQEEAIEDPWSHSVDERDLEMPNWEVESIEENI